MGLGKNSRPGKRSSSSASSYVSTVTMVVFVAFCVLAVWMLTSSSVVPPHTISRTRTITSGNSNSNDDAFASRISKPDSRDPPATAFDDNPGELPEDAIKGDEENGSGHKSDEDQGSRDRVEEYREKAETIVESQSQETAESGESLRREKDENQQQREETQQRLQETEEGNDENRQIIVEKNEGSDENQQESGQRNEENDENQQQSAQTNDENDENQQRSVQTNDASNEKQQQSLQQKTGEEREDWETETQQSLEIESEENQQQPKQPTEEEKEEHNQQQTQQQTEEEKDENHEQQTQQQTEEENNTIENQETQVSEDETGGNREETQQIDEKLTETNDSNETDSFPNGAQTEIPKETNSKKGAWSTQADQSENEKERRKDSFSVVGGNNGENAKDIYGYNWELCNVTTGADYIPCLDNEKALKKIHNTGHYEHRERHCPEEGPTCLVPLPEGYKQPIEWPKSRDRIWYHNVPHTKLAVVKGHQNWVKVRGKYLTFPGGGTQFIHGALHYIDFIKQTVPDIAWGKHTRVILDVGCGVASFGGYLFDRDVLAMSFAPKDEHEAQVQFALERGIPAISAVMGSQRLPFPSRVFDLVHCARCRVPWHAEGGALLLELNRVLRPGGYFVWSATPVYQKLKEDVEIWKAMTSLTRSMCWDLVTIKKDRLNSVGAAIYRKPTSNECYENRKRNNPPMCKEEDDPNAAWYVPLQACMHRVPVDAAERGSQWPEEWPRRVQIPPYWLNNSQMGVYGKPAPADFAADYEHWKRTVKKSYLSGLGISWSNVRNVMDMRTVYGGFAAALKDLKVWVLNVVNIDSPDTLPIIYERGLFGIYHDWCESFSTYPRTYDLLHADHLLSRLKKRCNIVPVMAEIDRILRPGGKLIVRDESSTVGEVENLLKSLHWEVRLTFSKDKEGILSAQKSDWRPQAFSGSS
eukprot:TRINITY_DN40_c2_g1_i1.p1 TRINITY_DN40_c2_g1~~TRINITY_DN40_c2_g1_i1.p1  ORF type:complete len:929 (+),score=217.13 TRINITY_DN40_c2_g1_i1:146-2932(+)